MRHASKCISHWLTQIMTSLQCYSYLHCSAPLTQWPDGPRSSGDYHYSHLFCPTDKQLICKKNIYIYTNVYSANIHVQRQNLIYITNLFILFFGPSMCEAAGTAALHLYDIGWARFQVPRINDTVCPCLLLLHCTCCFLDLILSMLMPH